MTYHLITIPPPHALSIDTVLKYSYPIKMLPSTITGQQLQEWRESQGLSRKWLSGKIGVSQSALWKWESADFIPVIAERACVAVKANLPTLYETTPTKGE